MSTFTRNKLQRYGERYISNLFNITLIHSTVGKSNEIAIALQYDEAEGKGDIFLLN